MATAETIEMISINQLIPSKSNPRKTFPEDSLQDLARSIEEFGVLQPILVQALPDLNAFEIIAGALETAKQQEYQPSDTQMLDWLIKNYARLGLDCDWRYLVMLPASDAVAAGIGVNGRDAIKDAMSTERGKS